MSSIAADALDGLDAACKKIENLIHRNAEEHEHLDAKNLDVVTMYIVGSIGAKQGRKGSDLDIIVELAYNGEVTGSSDWLEYVQSDIESSLQKCRYILAEPLPPYIGYVDPTLANRWDFEHMIYEMTSHGEYDRFYDVYRECYKETKRLS